MDGAGFVRVGRVARTHGLKGEVSVVETTPLPLDALVGLQVWFVPPGDGMRSAYVDSVRQGPKGPLLTLRGVTDITTAETLRGRDVAVLERDLPAGTEDVAFDPVGLEVSDDAHGVLGEIDDVIVTGANDVWVVRGGPFGEILVPVIDDVILDVDEDAGTVRVQLIPGLLPGE